MLVSFIIIMPATAAVNVSQTRVIFNEGEMAQSLALSNDGDMPVVVQAWLDTGDIASAPDKLITPVIATPPIFRMNPGEVRSLRLILTSRQALKKGQENLFWLNVYQITPERSVKEKNQKKLVLPLRLRLKVIVRPAGVHKLTQKEAGEISFLRKEGGMEVHNPSSWYYSISELKIRNQSYTSLLIPPKESIFIQNKQGYIKGDLVDYTLLNDSGNAWLYHSVVK